MGVLLKRRDLLVVMAACAAIAGCRGADSASRKVASPSDTVAINAMVASIERYTDAHPDRVELFAHVPGHAALMPVKDTTAWPENADTSYNLWRDSVGRPIKYVAVPSSESGDWYETITHWFGPDGRTIRYEYYVSSFEDECTHILRETKRIWLDPRGVPIAKTSRYTDADFKPIRAEKCSRRSDTIPAPRLRAADLAYPSPRAR